MFYFKLDRSIYLHINSLDSENVGFSPKKVKPLKKPWKENLPKNQAERSD